MRGIHEWSSGLSHKYKAGLRILARYKQRGLFVQSISGEEKSNLAQETPFVFVIKQGSAKIS
jgi:hypothetical protein